MHYLRPDGATLLDRHVYTITQLKAAGLRRTDPKAYRDRQVRAGYIRGVEEDRPAVISINLHLASTALNEFLARLHPFRYDDNAESAIVRTGLHSAGTVSRSRPGAFTALSRSPGQRGRTATPLHARVE